MELESYYMQIDISKVAYELAEDRFTELIQSGKIKNPYVQLSNGMRYSDEAQAEFVGLYEYFWNTIHSIAHD
jgi:hypothetical protein